MENDRERAIRLAKEMYQAKKEMGVDFSNGPCLDEEIIPNWCVDIAHNPRQRVDNLPENQCRSFREKQVHHFVELDPDGNLIRAV